MSSSQVPGTLTGRDPRLHPEYHTGETPDQERTVWSRIERDPQLPYRLEVGFISADKKQLGTLFDSKVEFKYVTVLRDDRKKFEQLAARPSSR